MESYYRDAIVVDDPRCQFCLTQSDGETELFAHKMNPTMLICEHCVVEIVKKILDGKSSLHKELPKKEGSP